MASCTTQWRCWILQPKPAFASLTEQRTPQGRDFPPAEASGDSRFGKRSQVLNSQFQHNSKYFEKRTETVFKTFRPKSSRAEVFCPGLLARDKRTLSQVIPTELHLAAVKSLRSSSQSRGSASEKGTSTHHAAMISTTRTRVGPNPAAPEWIHHLGDPYPS